MSVRQREWRLTIDLRQIRERSLLVMSLTHPEREGRWRTVKPVDPDRFEELGSRLRHCFSTASPRRRLAAMRRVGDIAGVLTGLESYLRRMQFTPDDALTIDTLVTSIPWDLLPFDDDFLAHRVAIGIEVPTPMDGFPHQRTHTGEQRFLHVMCNPRDDLDLEEESRALRALVDRAPGVRYVPLVQPTPIDLIDSFREKEVHTPFLHFSGHIVGRKGLLMGNGRVMGIDEIHESFPSHGRHIVFLNGCDDIYGEDDPGERRPPGAPDGDEHRELDLFQAASVANAFLYAGARAVIAPRSRVTDADASHAAQAIWSGVLEGQPLGQVVGAWRRRKVEQDPDSVAGYSYILYGPPGACADVARGRTPEARAPAAESVRASGHHELLQTAAAHADGPVAPRHLLGVLTRHWEVAHLYFDLEGQTYIDELEQLRGELGVSGRADGSSPAAAIELTHGGDQVIAEAMRLGGGRTFDRFSLLRALHSVGDPEVRGAMRTLDRGPRDLEELVVSTRAWLEAGGRPRPAVIGPDGRFDRDRFLPRAAGANGPAPTDRHPDPLTCWDLFTGLVHGGAHTGRAWRQASGVDGLPAGPWVAGQPLWWQQLDDGARAVTRRALIEAFKMAVDPDEAGRLTEAVVLGVLVRESGPLAWPALTRDARSALQGLGLSPQAWRDVLSRLALRALSLTVTT